MNFLNVPSETIKIITNKTNYIYHTVPNQIVVYIDTIFQLF